LTSVLDHPGADTTAKAHGRTAVGDVEEQSDACVVPTKLSNKHSECAETVAGTRAAKGNDLQLTVNRTQGRVFASRACKAYASKRGGTSAALTSKYRTRSSRSLVRRRNSRMVAGDGGGQSSQRAHRNTRLKQKDADDTVACFASKLGLMDGYRLRRSWRMRIKVKTTLFTLIAILATGGPMTRCNNNDQS